jgi:SAM-dependent methyltransferase
MTDTMTQNPNQALWEKGDFTRLAAAMRESGEELIASLGIKPGMKVLDLGCGDGTTAVPAARLGAQVLGVDIARNLVAAGNARAEAEGLANLRFEHGDASSLSGIADGEFDLLVSIFGACSRRARTTSRGRWSGSSVQAAGSSWATGYPAIPLWSRKSFAFARRTCHRPRTASSAQ